MTSVIMSHFNCQEKDVYLKYNKNETKKKQKKFKTTLDYRELTPKQKRKQITEKLHELETSKKIKQVQSDDILVSYDYTSLKPSAQSHKDNKWPAIETAFAYEDHMNDAVCCSFNSKEFEKMNLCCFLSVKYHTLENKIFQHLPSREQNRTLSKILLGKR